MNLIFNEYIEFLSSWGIETDLKEGYYWLDRQIIKAFDKEGNMHKVYRIFSDDTTLEVTHKKYDTKPFDIASWHDVVGMNMDRLKDLESKSIALINKTIGEMPDHSQIVLTSTGKDSQVVQYLVEQCTDKAELMFNNTSLDCADTYKFVKANPEIEIVNPKEGFYQWRKKSNFVPTRFARACCSIFKEGATSEHLKERDNLLFFMGMRKDESSARSGYTDKWRNNKWTNDTWGAVLPIVEWTELDIWLYTIWRDIGINPKYKKGYARVGCAVACPYYTKSTWVLDKYWYPIMYNRWQNIISQDFIDNNKWIPMNCTMEEYQSKWNGGTVRSEPTEEVIKEYALYNGLDIDIAKNYFDRECKICKETAKKKKRIRDKEVLAMNMKFLGRETHVLCKKHLKEFLDIDNKQWDEQVKTFESQGCELF